MVAETRQVVNAQARAQASAHACKRKRERDWEWVCNDAWTPAREATKSALLASAGEVAGKLSWRCRAAWDSPVLSGARTRSGQSRHGVEWIVDALDHHTQVVSRGCAVAARAPIGHPL